MSTAWRLPGALLDLVAILILVLFIFQGAMAYETAEFPQVTYFEASPPDDMYIVQIEAGNIHNAADHAFLLNSYGQIYELDVDVDSIANVWWEADISLTYPNGTIETEHLSQVATAWDYDIEIQFSNPIGTDTIIDVDLYIGLKPLSAQWNAIPPGSQVNYIPFSAVAGTSTEPMDVTVYFLTGDELQDIQQGDILGSFFSWSWQAILDFVEAIPGIGPYFAAFLDITVMVLEEGFWWFNFLFIENIEITILTIEFFIVAHSMLSTSSLIGLLKRIVDDHIAIFSMAIRCILFVRDLIMWVIDAVTSIIQAIKPV